MRYQITFEGESSRTLLAAFEEFELRSGEGVTTLVADLPDQAAVHGVIDRVGALGLGLIDIHRVPPGEDEPGSPR